RWPSSRSTAGTASPSVRAWSRATIGRGTHLSRTPAPAAGSQVQQDRSTATKESHQPMETRPQSDKAERLRALHRGPAILIWPNAWDVASAVVVAQAGFEA